MNKILQTSLLASSLGAIPLLAQTTFTWDGDTDATWNTATNWDLDSGTPVSGDEAVFNEAAGVGGATIDLGGTVAIDHIKFKSSSAAAYTIGSGGAGSQTLNLDNTGGIDINAAVTTDQTIDANIVLGDGSGGTVTFDNDGSGQLILNGNIQDGTGTGAAGNGKLTLDAGVFVINGDISDAGDAAELDVSVSNGADVTFNGNWTGSTGAGAQSEFFVAGGSTATITSGASVSDAEWQIRQGTVNLNSDAQKFNKTIDLGHGTLANGNATLNIGSGNKIQIESTINYVADDDTANTGLITGGEIYSVGDRNITVGDNALVAGPELTIDSRIGDQDSITGGGDAWMILNKYGAGTLRLTNVNNSYDWLMINEGVVQITDIGALGTNKLRLSAFGGGDSATLEYLGGDGTFTKEIRLQGAGTNLIANNGTGNLTLSSANLIENGNADGPDATTLTLGGANGVNTVSGVIRDNFKTVTGVVNIDKAGSNTWVLAGNNTHTGTTTVSEGALYIGGTNVSQITVEDGATIGGEGSTSGGIVFLGDSNIDIDASTTAVALSTSGALDLSSATSVAVNIVTPGAGVVDVIQYSSAAGFTAGVDGETFFTEGTGFSARGGSFADTGTAITVMSGVADNVWTGATDGVWEIAGAKSNWTGGASDTVFHDLDIVTFTDNGTDASAPSTAQTITISENVAPGAVNFTSANATVSYTIDGASAGGITGSTSLVKSGAGDLTINNANTYTGGTTLSAGDTYISNLAALGTGEVVVEGPPASGTTALRITGTGGTFANDLTFDNAGNNKALYVNLTGAESIEFTGQVKFDDSQGSWRNFMYLNDDHLTMSGLVVGNSGIEQRAGKLTLNNDANTFGSATGNGSSTSINRGGVLEFTSIANAGEDSALGHGQTLRLGNGSEMGTVTYIGTTDASSDKTIFLGGINDTTAGSTATGAVRNDGTGTLTFTAANFNDINTGKDVAGATRTLILGGSNTGDNTIQGVIRDNYTTTTAPVKLEKEDAGKWILSGTSTFTGGTTVNNGTLALGNATDTLLDTGSVTVSGGTLDIGANTDTVGAFTLEGGTLSGMTGVLTASSYDVQSGTINGNLGGAAVLTKTTGGTVTIANANIFSGATAVNAGRLNITGSITSAVTVNNGGILSGEGTIASFDTATGGILAIDGTTGSALTTTGDFNSSNGVSVLVESAVQGVFTVANYGAWDDVLGDFSIDAGGVQASVRGATFASTGSSITLDLGVKDRTWNNNSADGLWNSTSTNWVEGDNLFYDSDIVTFDDTPGVAQTITLGNSVAPASVTFNNTGANTYTIDDQTAGTETLSGDINITGSGDVNLNAQLTGNMDIVHSGTGALTLDGGDDLSNDFIGTITVKSGATLVDGGSERTRHSLGDLGNTLVVEDGGTFDIAGNNDYEDYGTGSIQVSGAGVGGLGALKNTGSFAQEAFDDELDFVDDVTIFAGQRFDVDGTISTTGASDITVTKLGGNSFLMNGDNTSASIAEWAIQAGNITAGNGLAFGNGHITVESGASLSGSRQANQSITLANDINLNGGRIETAWQDNVTLTLSGDIDVTAASRLDPNHDTRFQILTGALTGSGDLGIGNGEVQLLGNDSAYTGDFILDESNAILTVGSGTKTLTQDIVVADSGDAKMLEAGNSGGASGVTTITGSVTINEGSANGFIVRARTTDTLNLNGVIGGTGAAGIDINAARTGATSGANPATTGTVIFGADNTYTGPTTISGGTLQVGTGGALGTLGDGTGAVTNNGVLVFNTSDDNTVSGVISGTGAVTLSGSGATTLAGNNTYTGATAVNVGTLNIDGTNASAISVASGATLGGEGSTSGNIVLNSGSALDIDLSTAAALGTSGALDLSGASAASILVNLATAGTETSVIEYGSAIGFTAGTNGDTFFTHGTGFSGRGGSFGDTGTAITIDSGFADRTWDNAGADSLWNEGGTGSANWVEGDNLFYNGDSVTFDDTPGADQTITVMANVAPGTITFSNATHNYTINDNGGGETITIAGNTLNVGGAADVTLNAAIDGAGPINKSGTGSLIVAGDNSSFTGATTINEGVLSVEHSNALGTGTVTIDDTASSAYLDFGVDGLNIGNNIVFGGSNGTANRISFDVGGAATAEISGDIMIASPQTWHSSIDLGVNEVLTVSGKISGSNVSIRSKQGRMILTNSANDFTGDLTISDWSTVQLEEIGMQGVASQAGAGDAIILGSYINNRGTLDYVGSGTTTDRQVQVGSVASTPTNQQGEAVILSNGTGALVFSNTTFTQQDTDANGRIGARTLTLGGSNIDNNEIQGAILDNAGTAGAGPTPDNSVGIIKEGVGKWVLSGTNTYTGATTVNGGELEVAGTGSLANSSGVTVNNGASFVSNSSVALGTTVSIIDGTVSGTNLSGVDLTIGANAIMAPGNSTGTMDFATLTWDDGGTYAFEINNATGTAGAASGWDLATADTIAFDTDGTTAFTIDISTLGLDQLAGDMVNFDNTVAYTWQIVDADAFTGTFDASDFNIVYNGSNALDVDGFFSVTNSGGDVFLNYAVPEPGSYALLAGLFALSSIAMRRRSRK